MATLGHVLTAGSRATVAAMWAGQIAMWGALVFLAIVRGRPRRRLCAGVAAAGLMVTVAGFALAPPAPPQYDLSLGRASSAVLHQPANLRLCALYGDGSTTDLPLTRDIIDVTVDGALALETTSPSFRVPLTPGVHMLRFDLLAPDHRAFGRSVELAATMVVAPVAETAAQSSADTCR